MNARNISCSGHFFIPLFCVHIIKKRTFVYYEEYDSYEEYILFDRFDSCISV